MSTNAQDNAQGPNPPLTERIETQRDQIMKAMGIVETCRLASESMLDTEGREIEFGLALSVAYELLNDVASKLETIAREHKDPGAALS